MRTIAIDPGYEKVGVAVLEKNSKGKEVVLFSECFITSRKETLARRLFLISEELGRVVTLYRPESLAIESLFFANNQKTAIAVGQARGVILTVAGRNNLEVFEYTPLQVKVAVAGHGKATKEEVEKMVLRLTGLTKAIKEDDEYDAIAIGITHLASIRSSYPQG